MPAARKTPAPEPGQDSLLMIVGQLLEATKATTEGIKSLSHEVRSNATAIITTAKTLEMVEDTVSQLNDIVRGDPKSLIHRADKVEQLVTDLDKATTEMDLALEHLKDKLDGLGEHKVQLTSFGWILWYGLAGMGWLVTTGIAIWAIVRSK